MRGAAQGTSDRRAIVLAGGEGERLRPFIQRRLGRRRPKRIAATLERMGRRPAFPLPAPGERCATAQPRRHLCCEES